MLEIISKNCYKCDLETIADSNGEYFWINLRDFEVDFKYLKAKVREFNGNIKTSFLCNNVPEENIYYTCIACITLDSVLKINKKNYPQVYLEECKYKVKKINTPRFINIKLELDSESVVEYRFRLKYNNRRLIIWVKY